MRTPTSSNNMARRAIALLHTLRRGLAAYVVFGGTRSEQLRERLYRDAIGYALATNQRRSIRRPATDQSVPPGATANRQSTNPDARASAEDTQTSEAGSRLNDGPKPRTSDSNNAPGASAPDHATAADPRLILHRHHAPSIRRASLGRCPDPPPARRDGELIPRLRWLLTESAGTIANVAHALETRAADVDDHAREQLHDDILALDDELATVKTLLGNEIDWDADIKRLLAGEIPPFQIDAADEEGE